MKYTNKHNQSSGKCKLKFQGYIVSSLPGGQQTKNNVECGGIWALPRRREVNGIRGYLGEQTEPNQLCYSILRMWGKEEKEKRRKNDLE